MDILLIKAIILITLALIFYTIGVWSEKIQGTLKPWHLCLFVLGLICDTLGTSTMAKYAGSFNMNLHAITGIIAILLMLIHALWAFFVLVKNNETSKEKFHKFSIFVWCIWLIPYIIGMIMGMA